ncbi:sulfurtransferase [Thioalkalivibrio denitrificans]|uniref:Sulfurtransferase n=1 Tax=Thioalkalivibrio denitrificans TaxID=108003 RepID=A0A1V3NCB5_9GAMM|nr:rhodanese-like domain-containing protein [Thioalkalivibrio denitrificans]OOG22492.1 sulfurtransferase [Thioalkalivibrio denitrificans]
MYGIKEIDANTLRQWQDTGKAFRLLDVRTPSETAHGVIPGATLLPLHLVPVRLPDLLDEEEPLVISCRTGARSSQACAFLAQHGLTEVYNLRGGVMGWAQAGLNLEEPRAESVHTP